MSWLRQMSYLRSKGAKMSHPIPINS
jgi:hypothetical protein